MITIQNPKKITSNIFFATAKSTFSDFINDYLHTKLVFEFTHVADTVIISQPAIKDKGNYSITFAGQEVLIDKTDVAYDLPLFEERLIAFVHVVVD